VPAQSKELRPDRAGQNLGEKRGHAIADLPLNRNARSDDLDIVGEGLQAAEFSHAKSPILPMEGSDRRPRLGLNRP
jgi:hypothetical protein